MGAGRLWVRGWRALRRRSIVGEERVQKDRLIVGYAVRGDGGRTWGAVVLMFVLCVVDK